MTTLRTIFTRIRRAIFGKPLTHEESQARHEAQVATARQSATFENGARGRSVQTQTYFGSPF